MALKGAIDGGDLCVRVFSAFHYVKPLCVAMLLASGDYYIMFIGFAQLWSAHISVQWTAFPMSTGNNIVRMLFQADNHLM